MCIYNFDLWQFSTSYEGILRGLSATKDLLNLNLLCTGFRITSKLFHGQAQA